MRVEYHFEKVNLVFWKSISEKRFPINWNLDSNNRFQAPKIGYGRWSTVTHPNQGTHHHPGRVCHQPLISKPYLFLHIMCRNFTNFSKLAASTWVSIVFWNILSVIKNLKNIILKKTISKLSNFFFSPTVLVLNIFHLFQQLTSQNSFSSIQKDKVHLTNQRLKTIP